MPFGLCIAPATFQRLIEQILIYLVSDKILVYQDDEMIFAATVNVQFETLDFMQQQLINVNLKSINLKCSLFTETIYKFLHVMRNASIALGQNKLDRFGPLFFFKLVESWRRFTASATTIAS